MTDREFWVEVRRWLKTRIRADEQMIRAIEQRFGIEEQRNDRTPRPAA